MLEIIKEFFKVGNIHFRTRNQNAVYSVQSIKDINDCIVPHFLKYPLLTEKSVDFKIFCIIMDMMKKKEHLTKEGINKIINLRVCMNNKLINNLGKYFPDIIVSERPLKINKEIEDPFWLVGFVDAEGCFHIKKSKANNNKIRYSLVFSISQHIRDIWLIRHIADFISCGVIEIPKKRKEVRLVVYKYRDHESKVIPFFDKYFLLGTKFLDFLDYKKVSILLKENKVFKKKDIKNIESIRMSMNRNRNSVIK